MRVIITGASGFIGRPLCKKLSSLGFEILGISRNLTVDNSSISWLKADLSVPLSYENEVKAFRPDALIHLAWQDIPDFSYEKSQLNLNQSINFISFIGTIGSCKKLIIPGSCWEYSDPEGQCMISDEVIPSNDFSSAKNLLRLWLEIFCKNHSINLAWFRVFYVYGPGQKTESLLPSIFNSLNKKTLPNINTPYNANDFIYIEDVVDAFEAALNIEFPSGVYNLGIGFSTSVLEVCRIAEGIILNSSKLTNELKRKTKKKSKKIDFWADISVTKSIFDWWPQTDLVDGISKTWMIHKIDEKA